jgi:hypothetical protein
MNYVKIPCRPEGFEKNYSTDVFKFIGKYSCFPWKWKNAGNNPSARHIVYAWLSLSNKSVGDVVACGLLRPGIFECQKIVTDKCIW